MQNIFFEQDYKLGVNLPGTMSLKNMYGTLQRCCHHDVISGLQENVVISERVHDRNTVTVEH